MRTVKEDLTRIADALVQLEAATTVREQARWQKRLHRRMRAAMYRHATLLGLTPEDLNQMDNRGIIAFGGGTPKTDQPGDDEDSDGD